MFLEFKLMLGSSFVTLWEGHLKGIQTKTLRSISTGYITPVSNGVMTWAKQRPGLTEGTHYEGASYMTRKIIKEKRRWQTCCGIVTVTYLVYELMAVKLWTQWTMRLEQSVIECNGQHNIVKKREEIWRNKVMINCLKIHSLNFLIVLIETVGSIKFNRNLFLYD